MKIFNSFLSTILISILSFSSCKKPNSAPVTSVTSIYPTKGVLNSVITVTGTNFSTTPADNSVKINGVSATVYSASPTQLLVIIPPTATSGLVSLTVSGKIINSTLNFRVLTGILSAFSNNAVEHLAIDVNGNIYGDDYSYYGGGNGYGNDVVKFDAEGQTSIIAGVASDRTGYQDGLSNTALFSNIWGIATDVAGNIFVTDSYNNRIRKITPSGMVSTLAGNGTAGFTDGPGTTAQFSHPLGMAIDGLGNIYVCDNRRVRKINPTGLVSTLAGNGIKGNVDGSGTSAQFNAIEGIAVDALNNVFVSDNGNFNIRKVAQDGTTTTVAGSGVSGFKNGTGTDAQFFFPQGMAVDAAGNIFVSDSNYMNDTYYIRMINKVGMVSTYVGDNSKGPLTDAQINFHVTFPDGIALDPRGNIYFTNTGASYNNFVVPYINKITYQ